MQTEGMTKIESNLRAVLHWHTDLREVSPEATSRETAIYFALQELVRLREENAKLREALQRMVEVAEREAWTVFNYEHEAVQFAKYALGETKAEGEGE